MAKLEQVSVLQYCREQRLKWIEAANSCIGTLYRDIAKGKADKWLAAEAALQLCEEHK